MNPWRGLRNIPHNVWILAFATLINRAGTMVLPFLAIYLIKEIGLSAGEAGIVITFYGLGGLITAPIIGKLSDKLGAMRVMKTSLFLTGIMLFGYSFITNFYFILVYTFFWSIIGEAFRPANLSLLSTEADPNQLKTSFALNRLAINLGMSVGPVAGGFLSSISFHLLFYVDGITSILAAVFLSISHFKKRDENIKGGIENGKTANVFEQSGIQNQVSNIKNPNIAQSEKHKSIFDDKRYILFLLSLLPVTMVFFQHFGAIPIYLIRDLGFKESLYGMIMTINTTIIIFIEVPLNNAMNNWDDRKAIALGAVLCGIGFGAMALFQNLSFIILTVIIWTFGEMIFFPSTASYVSKMAPLEKRGEYMGYFQMTFSFSLMFGPLIGNEILDIYGGQILWAGTFVFCLLTAAMIFLPMLNSNLKAVK